MKTGIWVLEILLALNGAFWAQSTGLIAHYPFKGNAEDASGNGHHGIVYGAALTTDRLGNTNHAYSFDGTDDYIDVPYDSSFYPPSLGAAVWIKTNSLPDSGEYYILTTSGDRQTPPYDPFRLRLDSLGRIYARFEGNTDSVHINLFSLSRVNTGEWYFITAYYDALVSRGAIYVNGVKEDSTDRSMLLDKNTLGFRIGASQAHNGNLTVNEFFHGALDDIRIFDRSLPEEEILELYNEVVGITPKYQPVTDGFVLSQNYPNPFNPETTIRYRLPEADNVTLKIIDLLGRTVRSLVNGYQSAGENSVVWDGKDERGNPAGSGVYIYTLETGGKVYRKKMILLR